MAKQPSHLLVAGLSLSIAGCSSEAPPQTNDVAGVAEPEPPGALHGEFVFAVDNMKAVNGIV